MRAIKTIINIAEKLKLQYFGLLDTELTYMLDDSILQSLLKLTPGLSQLDRDTKIVVDFIQSKAS